jgi:hypothetical protein
MVIGSTNMKIVAAQVVEMEVELNAATRVELYALVHPVMDAQDKIRVMNIAHIPPLMMGIMILCVVTKILMGLVRILLLVRVTILVLHIQISQITHHQHHVLEVITHPHQRQQ